MRATAKVMLPVELFTAGGAEAGFSVVSIIKNLRLLRKAFQFAAKDKGVVSQFEFRQNWMHARSTRCARSGQALSCTGTNRRAQIPRQQKKLARDDKWLT